MKANTFKYPDFNKIKTFPKFLKYKSEIMPDEVGLRNNVLRIWNEYNKIVSELSVGLKSVGFKKLEYVSNENDKIALDEKIVDEMKKILNLNGTDECVNLG